MKKEWEKVEVGGRTYTFESMSAEDGAFGFLQVSEALGGIVSSAIPMLGLDTGAELGSIDSKSLLGLIDVDLLQKAITSATGNIKPEKIKALIDDILPRCFVTEGAKDGHRCSYDDFTGRLADLYKVFACALRYYYADFFAGLFQSGEAQEEKDA